MLVRIADDEGFLEYIIAFLKAQFQIDTVGLLPRYRHNGHPFVKIKAVTLRGIQKLH